MQLLIPINVQVRSILFPWIEGEVVHDVTKVRFFSMVSEAAYLSLVSSTTKTSSQHVIKLLSISGAVRLYTDCSKRAK